MTNKNYRKLFYFLRRLITVGGTIIYVLFQTGIFEDEVTSPTVKMVVWVLLAWGVFVLIKDYHKRALDKENPDIKQVSRATAMLGMIPWFIMILIAAAINLGVANIFQHLMVISLIQITGKILLGYETYYDLLIKREVVTDD